MQVWLHQLSLLHMMCAIIILSWRRWAAGPPAFAAAHDTSPCATCAAGGAPAASPLPITSFSFGMPPAASSASAPAGSQASAPPIQAGTGPGSRVSSVPAGQGAGATGAPLALPAAAAAGGAQAFTFGGARERDPVCRAVAAVAKAVAATGGRRAHAPPAKFSFRPARSPFARAPANEAAGSQGVSKQGPEEGPADAPGAVLQRAELDAANATAAAAAGLPLPALSDDEDEEGSGAARAQEPPAVAAGGSPPAAAVGAAAAAPGGAASGGGWGAAFLQQNAAASAATARAVQEEVERKRRAAAPAPLPVSGGGSASADTGARTAGHELCVAKRCMTHSSWCSIALYCVSLIQASALIRLLQDSPCAGCSLRPQRCSLLAGTVT